MLKLATLGDRGFVVLLLYGQSFDMSVTLSICIGQYPSNRVHRSVCDARAWMHSRRANMLYCLYFHDPLHELPGRERDTVSKSVWL